MPSRPLLMVELDIEGLAARVELNGVAVFTSLGRRSLRQNRRLNAWALPGENSLRVRLAAVPEGAASFSLALRVVRPGDSIDDTPPILTYAWNPERAPLTPAPRLVFEETFGFDGIGWRWAAGPAVEPGGGDRVQIDGVIRRLRTALVSRQTEEILALQAIQLEETAIAVGDDPGRYRAQYAEFLSSFFGDPTFEVEPYDADTLALDVQAGGRIVHPTTQAGPVIRARTSEQGMAIDPYFARIDGRWTIVR